MSLALLVAMHIAPHQHLAFCFHFVLPHLFHLQWLQAQFGRLRKNEHLDIVSKWLYCCLLSLFLEQNPSPSCGDPVQMTLTLEQLAVESGLPLSLIQPAMECLARQGYLELMAENQERVTWRIVLRE
jgi:hypothetical protein